MTSKVKSPLVWFAVGVGLFYAIGLVLFALASAFANRRADAEDQVEHSWKVADAPRIMIETFGGDIEVRPGPAGSVKAVVARKSHCSSGSHAEAKAALQTIRVAMTQDDDMIRIRATRPETSSGLCFLSASTRVSIPPGARLSLQTVLGAISISGAPGAVVADNRFGAVVADFEVGPAPAETAETTRAGKLVVENGLVFQNGREFGPVQPGDRVLRNLEGRLTVNGIERKPSAGDRP